MRRRVQLHINDGKINAIRPSPAWIPHFEELLASRWSRERETRLGRTQSHAWSGVPLLPMTDSGTAGAGIL